MKFGGWNPDNIVMIQHDPDPAVGAAGAEGGQGGQGGGTGDGGGNPKPAAGASPGAQGVVAGQGQGGQQQGERTYSYKEDRTDWVPRTRINELGGKIKTLEQQLAEHSDFRTRLGSAFGVNQPNGEEKEIAEAKEALFKVFPNLKVLEKLDPQRFEQLLSGVDSAKAATQAQWDRHATQMLTNLGSEVADALGVEKLTPTQEKNLSRAFREEARDCAIARDRAAKTGDQTYDERNDFISRYERGDATLLKEFAKAFLGDWVEPGRRMGAADVTRRQNRPTPRGERTRQTIAQGPPKIDYNNDDAFKKALTDARNAG
jgi:hypothetical protein